MKLFFLVIVFGLFSSFLFVIYTLSEIPFDELKRRHENKVSDINVVLEEGSIVNKSELRSYHLVSRGKSSTASWWELHQESLKDLGRGQLNLLKPIELLPLKENHCGRPYCYQHRIAFSEIPSGFWKGLIGIEDFRFLNHFGVDFKSILRALVADIKAMKFVQGGSTLTMQLAKNLYFTNERSLIRKIKEVIVAIYIEANFSKEEILEAYFNEFVWGSLQGIRIKGVAAASIFYFNKRPIELDNYEISILIAILNGPYYFHPINKTERLIKKTNVLYKKLGELNFFTKNEAWDLDKWNSWRSLLLERNNEGLLFSLWRSQKVESLSLSPYQKFVFVHKAGLLLKKIKNDRPDSDLAVKAYFADPFKSNIRGTSFYSKFERNEEEALSREFHQIGSTLKPLIYSLLTNEASDLNKTISTLPITLELKSGDWSPREAHDHLPPQITVKEALLKSYNRPLIRLAEEYGWEKLEKKLLPFLPRLKTPLKEYPSQLLGALELSLEELFQLYAKFIFDQCQAPNNDFILRALADPTQTTIRRQVGGHLKEMSFFGKTGTSNRGHDNWFVSYDGRLLSVIWVGLEGPRSTEDLKLYGGSTAFRIFQDFARDSGLRFPEFRCPAIPKS